MEESKRVYAATLKRLETLNTEIHEKRRSNSGNVSPVAVRRLRAQDSHKSASTGHSPELRPRSIPHASSDTRLRPNTYIDTEMIARGVSHAASDSELCPKVVHTAVSDTVSLDSLQLGGFDGQFTGSTGSLPSIGTSSVSDYCPTPNGENPEISRVNGPAQLVEPSKNRPTIEVHATDDKVDTVAHALVEECLHSAAVKLESESSRTLPSEQSTEREHNTPPSDTN